MVNLLGFGNDSTITLPPDSDIGDTHQRQFQYASILENYHYITLASSQHTLKSQQLLDNFWVHAVATDMRFYVPKGYAAAQKLLQTHPIDLISAQDPFVIGLTAYLIARRHKLPFSVQFAADMVDNPFWVSQRPLHRLFNRLGHWVIRRADTFRVVSQEEEQKLLRLGIPQDRIANLGWITDFSRFLNASPPSQRPAYLPASDKTLLLFVGRLAPQKNLKMLLHAFQKINQTHPNTFLLLAGDGPLEPSLKQLSAALGIQEQVHFAGLIPYEQIPALYALADIFVLSSVYEGNARVLAEAAASAKTAVSTAVSGASETVLDGKTGFVVPINATEQFVERVTFLLNHPEKNKQMGQHARQHIITQYDSQKLLSGFKQFWQKTAAIK